MTARNDAADRLDQAIDALLHGEHPAGVADVGGDLTATARTLRDVLPRFHPRFGFEELLADRLSGSATDGSALAGPSMRSSPEPIPLPLPSVAAGPVRGWERRRRGLLAGGAIASGVSLAIPLAGAAIARWRRSRSSGGLP